jgi:uncharacterized protein (TIGR00369 family)
MGGAVAALDQQRGFAQLTFEPGVEFCAHGELLHGGFLVAMLDEAMSVAGVVHSGFREVVPTLAMKTSYLRPVRRGRLVVEGEVERYGRRVAFMAGRLFDQEGRLCAIASSTVRVLPMNWGQDAPGAP